MRTLVEGTDHGRGPQWVKLSDDDARRAHEMKCNGATSEELRRHFRVRAAGSTWDRRSAPLVRELTAAVPELHGKREEAGEPPYELGAMRVCLTRVAWRA
jgi:hypothetical protein